MKRCAASLLTVCFLLGTASADERVLKAAVRERNIGIALSVSALAISVTGGAITIANGGFDRDTPAQQLRFGLGVGFAIAAVPIVTAGVTLWARGAIRATRERRRIAIVPNGLVATF